MSMLSICRARAVAKTKSMVQAGLARRFATDREGAAAVEFAMVAMPFFFVLFMIIEVSLVFLAGQLLETATTDASRLVMTGQAQTANFDQARFRTEVCNRIGMLIPCAAVNVDVQTYAGFGAANTGRPVGPGGFNAGGAGDIVVVRVTHEWRAAVPTFGMVLGDLPNGNRLLLSTVAFRNEPF